MNFGLELLGSPSHGNLALELAPGLDPVMVNTAIMSYNSPVIYRITTELHQNSIDTVEFSREAVLCFSRACYFGKLDELEMKHFRHVFKMAVVFKVAWLESRCVRLYEEIFGSTVHKEYRYEDFLVFYEEAEFASKLLKKEELLLIFVFKLNGLPNKRFKFVSDFTADIDDLSVGQLETLIGLFGENSKDFAKVLIRALRNDRKAITENCKYIVSNIDLIQCFSEDCGLLNSFRKSVDRIESFTSNDMSEISKIYTGLLGRSDFSNYIRPRSLFVNHYRDNAKLDDAIAFLSQSEHCRSLPVLIEGLFTWLSYRYFDKGFDYKSFENRENITYKVIDSFYLHGWAPVPSYLMERFNCFLSDKRLVSDKGFLAFRSSSFLPSTFFSKLKKLQLCYDETLSPEGSSTSGSIQLLITPYSIGNDENTFDIAVEGNEHSDLDLSADNIHFHLEIGEALFPVSWAGKPEYVEKLDVWIWGLFWFCEECDVNERIGVSVNSDAKISLVAFVQEEIVD